MGVQTLTGKIFVTKIKNTKTSTLLDAIGQMVQVINSI
jgi:hypothetical protein